MSNVEEKELLHQISYLSKLIRRHKTASRNTSLAFASGPHHPNKTYKILHNHHNKSLHQVGKNNSLLQISGEFTAKASSSLYQQPQSVSTAGSPILRDESTTTSTTIPNPTKIFINPNFKKIEDHIAEETCVPKLIASTSGVMSENSTSGNVMKPNKILVNPNFKTGNTTAIHINSKIFKVAAVQDRNKIKCASVMKEKDLQTSCSSVVTTSSSKYSYKTNRKLVRIKSKDYLIKQQPAKSASNLLNPLVSINKRKLVRLIPKSPPKITQLPKSSSTISRNLFNSKSIKLNKNVKIMKKYSAKKLKQKVVSTQNSKYKFVNTAKRISSTENSKFKLDNRKPKYPSPFKNSKSHANSSNKRYSWHKSVASQSQSPNKIYRYRKLSTSSQGNKPSQFSIQGRKFVMDPQGKTLKLVPANFSNIGTKKTQISPTLLKRIHVAGATYKAKAPDVYVRTNDHTSRNFVSQAKYKSINVLVSKLKKNNQPCVFYRRFGKCIRKEKGTCPCVHDPKQIAICKMFLRGKCEVKGCLLSHDVRPEKMPTCQYFLDGCCTHNPCPYLHVKVNDRADICHDFLAGYCATGSLCKKRHINICPEFDRNGSCKKGKSCPYPHKDCTKIKHKQPTATIITTKEQTCTGGEICPASEVSEVARYYQTEDTFDTLPHDGTQISFAEHLPVAPLYIRAKKRPKIGTLPSFIPL